MVQLGLLGFFIVLNMVLIVVKVVFVGAVLGTGWRGCKVNHDLFPLWCLLQGFDRSEVHCVVFIVLHRLLLQVWEWHLLLAVVCLMLVTFNFVGCVEVLLRASCGHR